MLCTLGFGNYAADMFKIRFWSLGNANGSLPSPSFYLCKQKNRQTIRKECAISHTKNHSLCFRYLKLRKFQVEIATVSALFFSDKCLTALYRNRVTWNHDSQSKLVFIVFYPHSHDQIQIMYCLYGKNSKNYLFLQPLNR